MVYFVGAGSGAVDLITVRGMRLLQKADVIIYAGSLVNPELLEYADGNCRIYDSAKMTLDEVIEVIEGAECEGLMTVRLHTGEPSIYGAVREQMDILDEKNLKKLKLLKASLDKKTDVVMMEYAVGFDTDGKATFSYYRERRLV